MERSEDSLDNEFDDVDDTTRGRTDKQLSLMYYSKEDLEASVKKRDETTEQIKFVSDELIDYRGRDEAVFKVRTKINSGTH